MAEPEADDECSSVSLDLSCDSSSFDGDDCGTTNAEEASDPVLPQILGVRPVGPYNFQPLAALRSTSELDTARPAVSQEQIDRLASRE